MSSHRFTISENCAPEEVASYQARLAKLKPCCVRCGRVLAKGELEARVCKDREVCRIRRSGCSAAGFTALRKYRREHPEPLEPSGGASPSDSARTVSHVTAEWTPFNPYVYRPRERSET